MGKFGYDFYFKIGEEVLTLPITPSSLKMKIGSNNKVVTLINEGEINLLKSPSLVEFEFDARFPMRKYPYSRDALNFETYLNKFTALKTDKMPFVFNVVRTTPDGKGTWATVRRVTLEDLEINEDADEGDDVIVSFSLKEYKEYGIKTYKSPDSTPTTTSTSEQPRSTDSKAVKQTTYVVQYGDCLWNIAKAAYGDGAKYTVIYEANKEAIEADAKKHGKSSSSNGNWIWAGLELIIPDVDTANLTVQKLQNNTSSNNTASSNNTPKTTSNNTTTSTTSVGSPTIRNPNVAKVSVTCNGIDAYAGTITISGTLDGKKVSVTNSRGTSLMVDKGTYADIIIHPKKGCSYTLSATSISWSKSVYDATALNLGSKSTMLYVKSIRDNMSTVVKWVK